MSSALSLPIFDQRVDLITLLTHLIHHVVPLRSLGQHFYAFRAFNDLVRVKQDMTACGSGTSGRLTASIRSFMNVHVAVEALWVFISCHGHRSVAGLQGAGELLHISQR